MPILFPPSLCGINYVGMKFSLPLTQAHRRCHPRLKRNTRSIGISADRIAFSVNRNVTASFAAFTPDATGARYMLPCVPSSSRPRGPRTAALDTRRRRRRRWRRWQRRASAGSIAILSSTPSSAACAPHSDARRAPRHAGMANEMGALPALPPTRANFPYRDKARFHVGDSCGK